MKVGYSAEQKELIEDLEKYDKKLKQFYQGLKLRKSNPLKASVLMGDAISYFEEFSEKHGDEEEQEDPLKETREKLKNYFDGDRFGGSFTDLSERFGSRYRSNRRKRNSERDGDGGAVPLLPIVSTLMEDL